MSTSVHTHGLCLCVAVLLASCGSGGSSGDERPPASDPPTAALGPPSPVIVNEAGVPPRSGASKIAVVNVTVVPMDREQSLEQQTVLIEDGTITLIDFATSVVIPADAEVLDGTGRYLMPGLIDMHAHLVASPGAEHDLLVELAAGVTTVRIMWGFQTHLDWRAAIRAGTLLGPSLYVASAGFEGDPPFWPGSVVVTNAADARAAVNERHAAGYDFIKVYSRLQLEPYVAILGEADRLDIPVVGHVPRALTADFAISSGQFTVEHFSRYAAELTTTGRWTGSIDGSKLAALVERIRLAGTWNCPTLTVQTRTQAQVNGLRANPLYSLLSQPMREWLESAQTQPPAAGDQSTGDRLRKQVLAALAKAGTGLLVGTDTGVQYVFPGFSIHEELAHFADAGLSPYQTLRAATVDAATALGAPDRGTIATGQRADLLLLDADPLADIDNVNRRVGLMIGGRWFAQTTLMAIARGEATP
jgi:imidazolonepropionase-like amidohydrolase